MKAWYFDNCTDVDQRLPHQLMNENGDVQLIPETELHGMSGVFYTSIDVDQDGWESELDALCQARQYKNRDELTVSPDRLPNYEEKLRVFFEEHIHEDEEIRFILSGSGYFDIRNYDDQWVRILVEKNDLIILPAGIYHRFTLDTNNYIKVIRLFKEDPKWTPINRPLADKNPHRLDYLRSVPQPNY